MLTLDLVLNKTGQYDPAYCIYVSLPSLSLPSINSLERCVNLLELDLSSNSLMALAGLETCTKLERLDVSCNLLRSLDQAWFEPLVKLTSLHLEGNEISDVDDVYALSPLGNLTTLTFSLPPDPPAKSPKKTNPLCSHPSYFSKASLACPNLRLLDARVLSLPTGPPEVEPDEEYSCPLPVEAWIDLSAARGKKGAREYVGEGGEEDDLREAFGDADLELERARSKLRRADIA